MLAAALGLLALLLQQCVPKYEPQGLSAPSYTAVAGPPAPS